MKPPFEEVFKDALAIGLDAAKRKKAELDEISKTRELYPFEVQMKEYVESMLRTFNEE